MSDFAVGFLEVAGYCVALDAMDKACKAADITIIGIDTINPKDTKARIPLTVQVKFTGTISNVSAALEVAKEIAARHITLDEITAHIINGPYEGVNKLAAIGKVKVK
ncbi:MAG: BMC domain-containing protein [Bacillota bacterium]